MIGAVSLVLLAWWLVRRKRAGRLPLIDPDLFRSAIFRLGISGQMIQQIALGGLMIALPIFLQMVLEYNALQAGLSLAPLSLSMFAIALLAGRRVGRRRRPAMIIRIGFALLSLGVLALLPDRPTGRFRPVARDPAHDRRRRSRACSCRSSTTTRWRPISEERISEAAGVNSAGGSFGLSFGLALAGA